MAEKFTFHNRLHEAHLQLNQTSMEASKLIDDSFSKRHLWIDYYNLLNGLFSENRVTLIHQAKTISVGMACIKLNSVYGFSNREIYENVLLVFEQKSQKTVFRELINLTSLADFIPSLQSISRRFENQLNTSYTNEQQQDQDDDQKGLNDQLSIKFPQFFSGV